MPGAMHPVPQRTFKQNGRLTPIRDVECSHRTVKAIPPLPCFQDANHQIFDDAQSWQSCAQMGGNTFTLELFDDLGLGSSIGFGSFGQPPAALSIGTLLKSIRRKDCEGVTSGAGEPRLSPTLLGAAHHHRHPPPIEPFQLTAAHSNTASMQCAKQPMWVYYIVFFMVWPSDQYCQLKALLVSHYARFKSLVNWVQVLAV
jgi:hypothetical protein